MARPPPAVIRSLVALSILAASAFAPLVSCDSSGTLAPLPPIDGGTDAALPPLERAAPATIPPDKRLDATSSPVVFDALRGGVWTANGDVGSISYVDVSAGKVVREIPVGRDVRSVALSPDFQWIAAVDRDGASVALVHASTGVVARTIALGTHPRAAVWDAVNPRWLYVAVEDADAVAVVDRTSGTLASTIAVGRLPSGVAVSAQRRELYVTHRIDAEVSVVDLDRHALTENVPLADEPADPDPKKPQGKPFAFESLAWAPDGNTAWLPHELLAPTHPFQFRETLFPTVSVVDLSVRAEVTTDPNDPVGTIAGRKNLFDAIDILDPTGNPSVLSQPCAAAFHPAGLVAYALACASEDLLVFDATTGIAIDLQRNLPGDHPVGLTLDDHGQRLFVVSDQSHTLLTFDTAGGNPAQRVTLRGGPLSLVAKDPVDPQMRAGLELFFNANSSKYPLATTANNWMSCGGCHLDGFVSTNKVFFEALQPKDPTTDAQIGHVGLKDVFSTAPKPLDPSFDPHDILVAMLDQGGLDGDRSGNHPTNVVDPSAPPAAATLMATQLARVVARDLPIGPSWLLDTSPAPNDAYDTKWCGQSGCHEAEYEGWAKSVHSQSAVDPMMLYCAGVEQQLRGPQMSRQCAGCHDPVSARMGDTSLKSKRGITCLGCHDMTREIRAGGNADLEASSHDWTKDHKDWAKASLATLRDPRFCGGCHMQFVPGTGLQPAFATLAEWQASPFGDTPGHQTLCVDCHMPQTGSGADHRAVGGNLYMGQRIGAADLLADQKAKLQSFMQLQATRTGSQVTVQVFDRGSGHAFPTGVSDLREAWVELQALDASGKLLARLGGTDDSGLLPPSAARLGTDLAGADGKVLLRHELSFATHIPFDRRAMPQKALALTLTVPSSLPAGTSELDAVLFYRNVRTDYFRAALASATAVPPETELARVKLSP